ncbi:hypothetical protein KFF05_08090 [bacterium SCSIO 12827]|nr:hypothetical protein KFF05_08090 [bacterium SCSIO 12827]
MITPHQRTDRARATRFKAVRIATLSVMAGVLLSGCGMAKPYVYDSIAYNRDDPDFAKVPETRDSVTICYSKRSTTPAEVARLAAETCAPYGTGIAYVGNSYAECPMLTPVGAVFACTGAVGTRAVAGRGAGSRSSTAGGTPGQPGTPLTGFAEGARPMGVLFGRQGSTASPAAAPLPALPPAVPGQPETKP